MIAAERERQVSQEGWTPEHDDRHIDQELAMAASCYALPRKDRTYRGEIYPNTRSGGVYAVPVNWPWTPGLWKPCGERVRELVKAGALIAAEIDRLLRLRDRQERK